MLGQALAEKLPRRNRKVVTLGNVMTRQAVVAAADKNYAIISAAPEIPTSTPIAMATVITNSILLLP
ncbi:MAG: hypothetical protein ACLTE2_12095 [Eubacteriales bacterium]